MKFEKNQELILKIDDLGNNGEGIGHVDGYALFVKDALPGETIRAKIMKCKKNYGFARMLEILPQDKEQNGDTEENGQIGRVMPRCPVSRQCGGCTLQHLCYKKQLVFKQKKVYDCLKRIGGVEDAAAPPVEWLPILGMDEEEATGPWHYRNKAQFPVRMQPDENGVPRPVVGFYAGRSHRIVPVADCVIQHESMKEILETVLQWMEEFGISGYDEEHHTGIVRHIYIRRGYHTGQIMVCLVINEDSLPKKLSQALVDMLSGIAGVLSICLNVNMEKTNVILGRKMIHLWGNEYIEDTIGDIRYRISPQSFYQVNPVQTEKLYRTALDFAELTGTETVWDLYCGIGTISLFLAQRAKRVYGVEIVPEAVENARENARQNGIDNVEFYCGAAERVVPELADKLGLSRQQPGRAASGRVTERLQDDSETGMAKRLADVVVVDPPRKGCDSVLLDTIVKMAPEKIVYVSCDPATLARDVKVLGEAGYAVRKVRACDMFPQGGHVECVIQMQLVENDKKIRSLTTRCCGLRVEIG